MGRGVRRRRHRRSGGAGPIDQGARRSPRPASRARSASARRGCWPRRRPAFAKPGGVARLDPAGVDPDDGRQAGHRRVGHRRPHGRPSRRARRHHRRAARPRRPRPSSPGPSDPTIGPHLQVLGLGGDDTPLVDRAARRPRTQPRGDVPTRRRPTPTCRPHIAAARRRGHRGRRRRRPPRHARRREAAHARPSSHAPRSPSCRRRPPTRTRWRAWLASCSTASTSTARSAWPGVRVVLEMPDS